MKKLCFILFLIIGISFVDVSASSINYELHILENRHVYETITYTIDKNSTNEYLNNILNNAVYFDKNNSLAYKKSVSSTSNSNVVTLKIDYDSSYIKNSKLLNSCFKSFVYEEDEYGIKYYATDPFSCSNHADSIVITVVSDIRIIFDDASIEVGNKRIWNKISDDFSMDLSLGRFSPDSDILEPYDDYEDSNDIGEEDITPTDDLTGSSNTYVAVIAGVVVAGGVVVLTIIKKTKKKDLID